MQGVIDAAEHEIIEQDILIKAAEPWSKQYRDDKESFKKLLRLEATLESRLRKYYREFAERSPKYIDWYGYNRRLAEISAATDNFTVDVLIDNDQMGFEDGLFIQVVYEPIEQAVELGGLYGEYITGRDIGISRTSELVQKAALEISAQLVGKRVDKYGNIVDNPNAKYRITETIRRDIMQALNTSFSLREDQQAAIARMRRVINNAKRAELIAQTETVNSYQKGLLAMGRETGAIGKEWQTLNYEDVCGVNARQGIIPFKDKFASGHLAPTAHPRCRCTLRLVYPEDPSAIQIQQSTNISPDEDLSVVYHGSGDNLSNGNYALGDAFYVSRDQQTAADFGKVKTLTINIPKSKVLLISSDEQYRKLVADTLLAYPGENFNQALPKFVLKKGFWAIEMSKDVDPLGGIAIVNDTLIKT